MKVYLYSFTSTIDQLYLTNDNIYHVVSGVTYLASAIESKEVVLDLKEVMGECTITMPWEKSGYLKDAIYAPYDAQVGVAIDSLETSTGATTPVFSGFINSVKGVDLKLELGCVSYVEQARDNFPRMYITRLCNHRLYSPACGLDPANWTTSAPIYFIDSTRQSFYVVIDPPYAWAENWFRHGYVYLGPSYRWVLYNTLPWYPTWAGGLMVMLVSAMHPIPHTWDVGTSINLVAGCDKMVSTCASKFNNFAHYLGFPYAPYEMIRLTGLKSTEVYTKRGGGKK